jgi:outer membrane protein assembly factor BamB/lysophospholipase L1-like esterase
LRCRRFFLTALPVIVLVLSIPPFTSAADWPQWRGEHRDGVWHEEGILKQFGPERLERRWTAPIGGGYGGPTVAEGRVYVMDRLDDASGETPSDRVLCFDLRSGEKLWQHAYACPYSNGSRRVSYACGPRAAVTIADGRAYALGTMGHLHCLDAATGKLLWEKIPGEDYQVDVPIWGIASSPLVEGELLIAQLGASGEGACLIGLDRKTGREVWRALDDPASYSSPIMIDQAGHRVLVCWTGSRLVGMDPKTGELHWAFATPQDRFIINVPTPVVADDQVFLTMFYDGSVLAALPPDRLAAEVLWRRAGANERNTEALHSTMSTPVFTGDYIYGVDSYGHFRCLDAKNGDIVWEDESVVPIARWSNVHFVEHGDRHFLFNERGELIIGRMSPEGFREIDRAWLLAPTEGQLSKRDGVCWSHPAFADRCVLNRNDKELVCAPLGADSVNAAGNDAAWKTPSVFEGAMPTSYEEGEDAEMPEYHAVPCEEFRPREGLGNVLRKLENGETVKVAYLGGSITAAPGWRVMTNKRLRERYPQATIEEIHAAIGGTGSDLGVYRLGHDVLRHDPDLLFIEFAVNDGGRSPESIWRSMEGIVRQTWRDDPTTDICFVYTFRVGYEDDVRRGNCWRAASAMEMLAEYYGIPSINVAVPVVEREAAGELVFKVETPPEGEVIHFSTDGVHPKKAGHAIYADTILDAFSRLEAAKEIHRHERNPQGRSFVPDPMVEAKMVPVRRSMLEGDWKRLPEDHSLVRRFGKRLGEIFETTTPGATLSFSFRGSEAKLYDLLGPDGGQVIITVDGETREKPVPRFDSYCTYHRLATLTVASGLDPEKVHHVTVEVHPKQPDRQPVAFRLENPEEELQSPKYQGRYLRVGKLLILGEWVEK